MLDQNLKEMVSMDWCRPGGGKEGEGGLIQRE